MWGGSYDNGHIVGIKGKAEIFNWRTIWNYVILNFDYGSASTSQRIFRKTMASFL